MLAGKPIIASCVDAIPNIIKDGKNGLLVKVDDEIETSKKVVELYKNPDYGKQLVSYGLKDVYDRFDARRVAIEHEGFI